MTGARPRFSIVTAVYNVEPYLADFIASIEAQRFDLGRIEVIAVDDGSTDGSRALLEAWAARRPGLVTVLSQPNGGQGSARNLGLELATGEWVTFTDPDDVLGPDFFRVVDRFAAAHADLELIGPKPLQLDEREGRTSDVHPRSVQFARGNRRIDLGDEPDSFLGVSAGSLYKLDRLRDLDLRFDPRVRPTFEDVHFAAGYLMTLPRPVMGIVPDAIYVYRLRSPSGTLAQAGPSGAGRHADVLRFGYLDVLERARSTYGSVPAWVQHLIIYELAGFFAADELVANPIQVPEDQLPAFQDLLCQVIGRLDPQIVRGHRARRLRSTWVDILAHACRGADWHSQVTRTKKDAQMGLQRVSYRYVGRAPDEAYFVHGVPVAPVYRKTMAHVYYGHVFMHERIAWLPIADLQVRINGRPRSIAEGSPLGRRDVRPLPRRLVLDAVLRRVGKVVTQLATSPWRLLARLPPFRATFRDAWVLMDRIYNADDNAERLFEYLRVDRPDINAWFVIEHGTPEWDRLRAAHGARVIAHGSRRWILLMLNCSWLLSSHAARAVADPLQIARIIGKPTWRYAFLQHGVMKDDLSKWLNNRDIEMFVVSTVDELESVVADDTSYLFTTKETRNTGLPRFDRLLAKGRAVAPDARNLLLIAPTWRMWLTDTPDVLTHRRIVDDEFWWSQYFLSWMSVVRSPEIAAAAARHGVQIAFMPHPNMQQMLPHIELPTHVLPLTFVGNDVQDIYARCGLLVTDYSSVAFNAAYLDRPVVYYQFDRDKVMSGAHLGRKGYFEYERDGFGPVVTDAADAIEAIVAAIEHGPHPTAEYQVRIDRTFADRDGRACARVVAAIEELSRPHLPGSTGTP